MAEHRPNDEELLRLRAEVEVLMKVGPGKNPKSPDSRSNEGGRPKMDGR
jgi:hypothetical protein